MPIAGYCWKGRAVICISLPITARLTHHITWLEAEYHCGPVLNGCMWIMHEDKAMVTENSNSGGTSFQAVFMLI